MGSDRDDFEPVTLGRDDLAGEGVAVIRTGDGRALLMPRSMARLRGEQSEIVAEVQRAALAVHEAQAALDELVQVAREVGVAWPAIGWSVGVTAEGARQRWG